ncbi:MAG TPA: DUF1579 family protein [Planctomycetia bacterium]|nr:DUF1579 family protein [Planctomycetia bacterium]
MRSAVFALLAGFATAAAAQGPVEPSAEHKKLSGMVGRWDATLNAGGTESKGVMVFKWGPGKLFVVSDFNADMGGMKFTGHGVSGYDPAKKKYVGIWTDSMSPSMMTVEGTMEGDVMTEIGTGVGPDGKPMKTKMTTEMKGKDAMTFKMYMVEGDKDNLAMTIEYKRAPNQQKKKSDKKPDAKPSDK